MYEVLSIRVVLPDMRKETRRLIEMDGLGLHERHSIVRRVEAVLEVVVLAGGHRFVVASDRLKYGSPNEAGCRVVEFILVHVCLELAQASEPPSSAIGGVVNHHSICSCAGCDDAFFDDSRLKLKI
jgi:hypothetical protein